MGRAALGAAFRLEALTAALGASDLDAKTMGIANFGAINGLGAAGLGTAAAAFGADVPDFENGTANFGATVTCANFACSVFTGAGLGGVTVFGVLEAGPARPKGNMGFGAVFVGALGTEPLDAALEASMGALGGVTVFGALEAGRVRPKENMGFEAVFPGAPTFAGNGLSTSCLGATCLGTAGLGTDPLDAALEAAMGALGGGTVFGASEAGPARPNDNIGFGAAFPGAPAFAGDRLDAALTGAGKPTGSEPDGGAAGVVGSSRGGGGGLGGSGKMAATLEAALLSEASALLTAPRTALPGAALASATAAEAARAAASAAFPGTAAICKGDEQGGGGGPRPRRKQGKK